MKTVYILLSIALLTSCMKGKKVDAIFHNASILCLDDSNTSGQAIAIKNGKIMEVGPERQILNKYRADEITDVQGKEIAPNFSESNLQLDSILSINVLQEIENQKLERGITIVITHHVTYTQLLVLLKFSNFMKLTWYINLAPDKKNFEFIRSYKLNKNSKLHFQGFTIGENTPTTILEACAITKNKHLQIGLDFKHSIKNISLVIKSLEDYKKDHRWFAFNIDTRNSKILKLLEENNFFLLLNKNNRYKTPFYIVGSFNSNNNLYSDLSIFSKLNHLNFAQTLKSISNWANYLSFTETTSGSLSKGKNANFTIFETSLSTSSDLNNIYSNSTFIQGKKIYSME